MTNEDAGSRLHIDSDWKQEAQREKERLAEEEKQRQASGGAGQSGGPHQVGFLDLVNLLAMQASVGLSGFGGPGGQQMPPDPALAKHYIDLLDVLEEKTAGNLSDEEKRVLSAVTYELRMQFVHGGAGGGGGAQHGGGGPKPG